MIHLDGKQLLLFFCLAYFVDDMIDMDDLFHGKSENYMEDLVVTHALVGKPSHPKKW